MKTLSAHIRFLIDAKYGLACALLLASALYSSAYPDPYHEQNFEDWPVQLTFTNASYNGWYITDGCVRPRRNTPPNTWLFDAHSSSNMAGLNAPLPNGGSPRKSLQTPLMNDGAGYVSFYFRNALAGQQYFELQYSTNGGASWITNSTIISSNITWTHFGSDLNIYGPVSVKIEKTGDNNTAGQWLLLDTVSIELPVAYALISEVQLNPAQPVPNTTQLISATIEPKVYGSNTTAKVVYSTNNWATSDEASMTETSANHYATVPGITGIDNPGLTVQYYIDVMLDGPTTNNTHSYWPSGAPSTKASYQVRAKPYASSYASMIVTGGPPATAMMLQDDYIWRGVTPLGIYTNPSFSFRSGATIWGDIDQSSTTQPLTGIAETSGTIDLTETVTNHLAFIFNETATNMEYSIQSCEYAFFDDMAGATNFSSYTNSEQWVMLNARTTAPGETNKALTGAGMSAVLRGASNGVLRTPFLGTGIGVVSFYMRNWLDDGSAPVKMSIEKSFDASTWIPVTSVDSILTPDYIFYSINLNDDTNRYIRIVNTSVSTTNYLCLDNVSATAPGAFVKLSSPTIVPAAPTFSPQPVNVTIDFVKSDTATNLEGRLYWKASDSDDYDWIMMSTTGSTFYGQIPPTIGGTVFYYFECLYDGFNATPVQHPEGGTNAPLSFTASTNIISSRRQDFEAWPSQLTFANVSYNGWNITNGCVRPKKPAPPNIWPYDPYEGLKMGGLNAPLADGAFPRFGITSPLFTNGVSVVAFACRSAFDTLQTLEVQSSIDFGSSWTTNATIAVTSTLYTIQQVQVDTFSPTYIRIEKTGDGETVGQFLILDDITCAPPSADVIITNLFLSPGYPGTNNDVTVSCDVFTKDPVYRAFNFRPKLAFTKDGTWTTNAMSQTGSNTWTGTIDAQQPVEVQYFIRCDFAGYYYTNSTVSTKRSPAFYPSGSPTQDQPDSFLKYVPRRFSSEFDSVSVTSSVGNVSMSLVEDHYWQGVFKNVQSTQLVLNFSGLGYFDPSSGYSSETNSWGDDLQDLFDTPLSGIATQGASSIVLNINTSSMSQVLILFNSRTGYYEVRRGAYEDFDEWRADPNYFANSLNISDMGSITNDFNSWPTNAIVTRPEPDNGGQANFEDPDWPVSSSFSNSIMNPINAPTKDDLFYVENWRIATEVNTNHSLELDPTPNLGATWPRLAALTDGLGTLTWKARCRFQDNYLTWYTNGLGWSNYYVKATVYATDPGVAYPRFSIFANYQNASNYFEAYLVQTNTTQVAYGIRSIINGLASAPIASSTANTTLKTPQTVTFSISPRSNGAYLHIQLGTATKDGTTTSTNLNAGGSIGFLCDDTDIIVDDIEVRPRTIRSFNISPADSVFSTYTNDNWVFTDARRTGSECLITNNTNASVASPTLPFTPGELHFSCATPNPAINGAFIVEGFSGSTWTNIGSVYSNITYTAWTYGTISNGLSGFSRLRLRNASTNAVIRIDYIWITAGTNTYTESFTNATSTNAWAAPYGFWELDSANQHYKRQAYCGPEIGFKLESNTNISGDSWPTDGGEALVDSFTISNHQYEVFSHDFKYWNKLFTKIQHTTGAASLRLDDITMSSWRAQDFESNGWTVTEGWVRKVGADNNQIELWRSRANPTNAQAVRSPKMTNGIGSIEFDYDFEGLDGSNATFIVEWDTTTNSLNWFEGANYTVTPLDILPGKVYLDFSTPATNRYVRVRHTTSNNTAIMKIDNLVITDYKARDDRTWEAYNAKITSLEGTREFEPFKTNILVKTAFLNLDPSSDTLNGAVYSNSVPFIQSSMVTEGIGRVSFWYRAWEADGSPAGTIRLYAAGIASESTTNLGAPIAEIASVDNTQYRLYQNEFNIKDKYYLRLTSGTNGQGRVCIDNMLVAQPLGADFEVQLIEITPTVPLNSDTVKIAAEIGRFIMNPSNIQAKAYYHIGTNNWGNYDGQWNTNANFLSLSKVTTNGNVVRFETADLDFIPAQNIDTVVQYYVEFTFDGTFAKSPKQGRTFTNPSWYSNINLNVDAPTNTPYYIVYSCPPGHVWINEFNYYYNGGSANNEFVEIAGKAGSIVNNWRVELVRTSYAKYGDYPVTNITALPDTHSGFGFWVLGDAAVTPKDQIYTNTAYSTYHMETAGGIRLVRSSGIWEDSVSYGTPNSMTGFTYSAARSGFIPSAPIILTGGTGELASAFTWSFAGTSTPSAPNTGQTLELASPPPPTYTIMISNFWSTSSNTWIISVSSHSNQIAITPEYTTNIVNTNWVKVPIFYELPPVSGVYSQYFDNVTNTPPVYFRVSSTNAP